MMNKILAVDSLFGDPRELEFATGARLLPEFLCDVAAQLVDAIHDVGTHAPFRIMQTPGGRRMSVAMTNCGTAGWVSDAAGYRYTSADPRSGKPWPAMPRLFFDLAVAAAARAGYPAFAPDACLINRYEPGARLTLHQDRDEHDTGAPIVSFSLGLPAVFVFGGMQRTDPLRQFPLVHGDAVVWGGPARLAYHGILPLAAGVHSATGRTRLNLTFRKAL